jgi:uncharacterized membrane protein
MDASIRNARRSADARNLTLIVYGLQLAGILIALTPVIGVILNHARRQDATGTIYASHFDWQIRTFWWTVLWLGIGALTIPLFGIGLVVMALAAGWFFYRAIRGILNWHQRDPMRVRS